MMEHQAVEFVDDRIVAYDADAAQLTRFKLKNVGLSVVSTSLGYTHFVFSGNDAWDAEDLLEIFELYHDAIDVR